MPESYNSFKFSKYQKYDFGKEDYINKSKLIYNGSIERFSNIEHFNINHLKHGNFIRFKTHHNSYIPH